ncbi:dihydrofolate reductase family protein [Caulobacter sp. UNC279MFTsu5.1]|uniref:dihydrofolate reductase family protein n=1 Tax=Caulobacter sp. UNC279MFTsu5.1 TaxID=1502775 RepID=UPI00035D787A|nr:dihydrofolate reductase family protein [Caulobacter sp. UNC279MFTsu5.1]SFK67597.1 Dihydrofolate reductase [Caulobacter sp. UNC279MFTsu5.1]
MRSVVLIMTASIDGYVVAPSGMATGAQPEPPELKAWKLNRIRQAGTHIMGRVSYEEMGPYWQASDDAYAAPMNDIPKVVFSKTLRTATWPKSTIASGDLAEEIDKLRRRPGGEIIAWGGARFAQALTAADLVDEYVLITRPVVYGAGRQIFEGRSTALGLDVLAASCYHGGLTLHQYRPRQTSRSLA